MPGLIKLKWRQWSWRRRLVGLFIALVVMFHVAKVVVHRVAVSTLADLVGGRAEIGHIAFGVREIAVRDVALWTNDVVNARHRPSVAVAAIDMRLSLLEGLRGRHWIDEIQVSKPVVRLRFDNAGKMLTRVPESKGHGNGAIPFRTLQIYDARLIAQQPNRRELDIDHVSMQVTQRHEQLDLIGIVPDLLGAKCEFRSHLDPLTFRGDSELRITGISLSTVELGEYPLMPQAIAARNIQVDSLMSLKVTHSNNPNDIRDMTATATFPTVDVSFLEEGLTWHGDIRVDLKDGILKSRISGEALAGVIDIESRVAFNSNSLAIQASVGVEELSTEGLPPAWLPRKVNSVLNAKGSIQGKWSDGRLALNGMGTAIVTGTEAFGFQLAPTFASLKIDGVFAPKAIRQSSGTASIEVKSDGVDLEQLADALQNMSRGTSDISDVLSRHDPTGLVRVAGRLQIPFAWIDDPRSYELSGMIDAGGASTKDFLVTQCLGTAGIQDGRASLEFNGVRVIDRTENLETHFNIAANFAPNDRAHFRCDVQNLSATTLTRLADATGLEVKGKIKGTLQASVAVDRSLKPTNWNGLGYLAAQELSINNETVDNCAVHASLSDTEVAFRTDDVAFCNGVLVAHGRLALEKPFVFEAQLACRNVDLARSMRCAPVSLGTAMTGQCGVRAQVVGSLASQDVTSSGELTVDALTIGRCDYPRLRVDYEASADAVNLESPRKEFFGGQLKARLIFPSGGSKSLRAVGQIDELPVSPLSQLVRFEQPCSGEVNCRFDLESGFSPFDLKGSIGVNSARVTVGQLTAKRIMGKLDVDRTRVHATMTAGVLGGKAAARASMPVADLAGMTVEALDDVGKIPVLFQAELTNMQLERMWPILRQQTLRPLSGTGEISLERTDSELKAGAIASGKFQLRNVRWNRDLVSSGMHSDIQITARDIRLQQLGGTIADGRISGNANIQLHQALDGSFQVSASQVRLGKALSPFGISDRFVDGTLSARLQGRLGRRPSGRATVSLQHVNAGPASLTRIRAPIDWSIDPQTTNVDWRISKARIDAGGGRVFASAKGRWNGRLDMSLSANARGVDTGRVLLHKGGVSGVVNGNVVLRARRAQSLNDFVGRFDATLVDARAMQIPVLSSLPQFMDSISASTTFDESKVNGRMGKGMVYVDRLTLSAANAQILVEGTSTLTGRLNMKVTARTGSDGPGDRLIELAQSPLLLAAPVPIAVLARANEALKDRVLHLQVSGTAANPTIRLQPGRQLGEEAIKFFTNQAFIFANRDQGKLF